MANVDDVAAAIIEHLGELTTLKLQKLLYYCQGWHLAWEGVPLFDDEVEAWANGPVIRSVYDKHRGRFVVSAPWPGGDASRLDGFERTSVDAVLDVYGKWSPRELMVKSHEERPWVETRGQLPDGARSERVIPKDLLLDYFGGLLDD